MVRHFTTQKLLQEWCVMVMIPITHLNKDRLVQRRLSKNLSLGGENSSKDTFLRRVSKPVNWYRCHWTRASRRVPTSLHWALRQLWGISTLVNIYHVSVWNVLVFLEYLHLNPFLASIHSFPFITETMRTLRCCLTTHTWIFSRENSR